MNILTMLYKKFAGLIGGILSTIVLKYMRNRHEIEHHVYVPPLMAACGHCSARDNKCCT